MLAAGECDQYCMQMYIYEQAGGTGITSGYLIAQNI